MISLFRVFIPLGTLLLLVVDAALIVSSYVLASFLTQEADPSVYLLYDGGLLQIAIVMLSIILGLHFHDLYSEVRVKSRILLLQQLCLVAGEAFLVQALVSYLDSAMRMPVRTMLLGSPIAIAGIFGWRQLYAIYYARVVGRTSVLLFGGSRLLEAIGLEIEKRPELGLAVAGYVDDCHRPGDIMPGGKVLGAAATLREIVDALRPGRIVVGIPGTWSWNALDDLLHLQLAGFHVEDATATYERITSRVCLDEIRPVQLICSDSYDPHGRDSLFQSLLNQAIAVVAVLVTAPLMLLIALAIRFSSTGPVLARQTRVGRDGVPFTIFKFRTQYQEGDKPAGESSQAGDPRLTPLGAALRRYRLDILPEFFNVLRGEMAVVGPRPERPEYVSAISSHLPFYGQRHRVRPGITGWAQVNVSRLKLEDTLEKLSCDLYYIRNWSLSLDSFIIFNTLKTVLLGRSIV